MCYKYTCLNTHEHMHGLPTQRKRRSTTEGAIAEVGAEALLTRSKENLLAVHSGHLHARNSAPQVATVGFNKQCLPSHMREHTNPFFWHMGVHHPSIARPAMRQPQVCRCDDVKPPVKSEVASLTGAAPAPSATVQPFNLLLRLLAGPVKSRMPRNSFPN